MASERRRPGFLIGLIMGAVIGSVLAVWITQRVRKQWRERGIDLGRAGELAALARERGGEFLARARQIIRQAIEEGREAATKTRSELEERFKKESEE